MTKQIEEIINSHLQDGEETQKELAVFLESMIERVIEAGIIKSNTQTYRYGSDEISKEVLSKRIINNLALMTRPMKPFRAGLIDESESTLKKRHASLEFQISIVLKNHMQEEEFSKVSSVIAERLLDSWSLTARL